MEEDEELLRFRGDQQAVVYNLPANHKQVDVHAGWSQSVYMGWI